MKFYQIRQQLREVSPQEGLAENSQYVAVITRDEWRHCQDMFQMGIDMELELDAPHTTKAEVNYDSLTGSFSIPDRRDPEGHDLEFSFALDERGMVLIDDSDAAIRFVHSLSATKKWHIPSLERFLYDFLELIVGGDLALLEEYEKRLSRLEDQILSGSAENVMAQVAGIRGDLLALRTHYEQMLDIGQEFNENENGFFRPENLRYFDMFCARIMRLQDYVTTLRELTIQARDLYQSQLSVKQNTIMTILTVVTVIFMPLTLIAGWYGMNFRYMPELQWRYSYPVLVGICLLIVAGSLIFFRRKKWL